MIRFLDALGNVFSNILALFAGITLVAMMLLACSNMVLRPLGYPVDGTFELMGFFGAVVASFSLAFAQRNKAHVSVGMLLKYFPPLVRRLADAVVLAVSALFFVSAGMELSSWAGFLVMTGELSETLRIIYYPFMYATSIGCFLMGYVLLVDGLKVLTAKEVA